jgi:hypothetical protein
MTVRLWGEWCGVVVMVVEKVQIVAAEAAWCRASFGVWVRWDRKRTCVLSGWEDWVADARALLHTLFASA